MKHSSNGLKTVAQKASRCRVNPRIDTFFFIIPSLKGTCRINQLKIRKWGNLRKATSVVDCRKSTWRGIDLNFLLSILCADARFGRKKWGSRDLISVLPSLFSSKKPLCVKGFYMQIPATGQAHTKGSRQMWGGRWWPRLWRLTLS